MKRLIDFPDYNLSPHVVFNQIYHPFFLLSPIPRIVKYKSFTPGTSQPVSPDNSSSWQPSFCREYNLSYRVELISVSLSLTSFWNHPRPAPSSPSFTRMTKPPNWYFPPIRLRPPAWHPRNRIEIIPFPPVPPFSSDCDWHEESPPPPFRTTGLR